MLNIFISGIDDSITAAIQQRYNDQAALFRHSNVTPTDMQLGEVLHNLASYADTLRRETQNDTRKNRRGDSVNSVRNPSTTTSATMPVVDVTRATVQPPPVQHTTVPRLEAPPTTLAITSGAPSSSYQQKPRNDSPRSNDARNTERGYTRDYPDLPMDVRFVIPPGWTDIRRAVHDFIDKWHHRRICLLHKNASPPKVPHKTSECPALSNDPEARYRALAYRLVNVRPMERMLLSGEHAPIQTNTETIGPVREGLRPDTQGVAGMPPPILRQPPPAPAHPKN